jgi:hypothetical protein
MSNNQKKEEAYNRVLGSTIILIKNYVKAGYGCTDIFNNFNVTKEEAEIFYFDFSYNPNVGQVDLGHKNVPYYKDEIIEPPKYSIDDLKGEELKIAKQNINPGKLWRWEE